MRDEYIDYGKLIDEAMHIIVKKALEYVREQGLPGKHHFFISFSTSHPDVSISEELREKYPEEMTIVLQHQFDSLEVFDDHFSVSLSFDNVKEKISVPFDSLVAFADPGVKFGLQFRHSEDLSEDILAEIKELSDETDNDEDIEDVNKIKSKPKSSSKLTSKKNKDGSNIVSLDKFRKKNSKKD